MDMLITKIQPCSRIKRMFKRILKWALWSGLGLLILTVVAALIWKDTTLYLWQSVRGQVSLLLGGQAISELEQDARVPQTLKQQFKRVAEVKQFAEQKLGLKPTRNFKNTWTSNAIIWSWS